MPVLLKFLQIFMFKKFLIILLIIFLGIVLPVFIVVSVMLWNILPGQIQNKGPKDMAHTSVTKSYFNPTPMSVSECKEYKRLTKTVRLCREEDYWLGAVSECGGVHNLPTWDQLENIAKYVYHNGKSNYDGQVAVKYGLPEKLDGSIIIISKHVDFIQTGAVGVVRFGNSGFFSYYTGFYKTSPSRIYAICVKNQKLD